MKKISLFIISILACPLIVLSQQFEWVHSNAMEYSLNPALPVNMVCASDVGPVYAAYIDSNTLIYGQDVYGKNKIDCYNSIGELQWSFSLGNRSVINRTVADNDGNLFVGGSYMETLSINETDSLTNTGSGYNINVFLLCINSFGEVVWKRNVTLTHPDYYGIAALTIDQDNNFWFGATDFFSTEIFKVDGQGDDVISYQLPGAKTLGGLSFDSHGNLYASGATGSPSMSVVNLIVTVPETYMMYVTRITAAGEASWVQLSHDVTFQMPQVKADPWGSAYVSGTLMFEGTSFGSISFLAPQWVYDVFLVRVDSTGIFHWGIQAPQSAYGITGDFDRGKNVFLDADENGNAYISGVTRGTLDWGNGVTSGGGLISYGEMSVLEFDTSGTALWAKNASAANGFIQANSLDVNAQGECYFTASITDEATFDTISLNANADFASVVGKISAGIGTSVPNVADDHLLILYPNPASDELYFSSSLNGATLKIFGAQGKCIRDFTSIKNSALDVSGLSEGIYLVRYVKGSEMKSGRFAIVR
ncbi:MAG TPA: T9SS type A sorting domain-containing protein [Chitinophagales bacterium]|nr:T9SS type A sorting domain-containing protein [Chitinophagales bacterium]